MADGNKNQEMGFVEKKTHNSHKRNLLPIFNRSLTANSFSLTAAVAENRSIYISNYFQPFQRNGSIKNLHSSPILSMATPGIPLTGKVRLPGTEDSVVIYFTSLRGGRTFQDCHSVRMIFRGLSMNLDERDISMDSCYRKELQKVLGVDNVNLPLVFIKGMHIGGADVIKPSVEVGELARLIKVLPLRSMKPCDACVDARFILCTNCNGSRKVFDEVAEKLRRCPECNENGLIGCLICS